jgi:hypothetical protein
MLATTAVWLHQDMIQVGQWLGQLGLDHTLSYSTKNGIRADVRLI